MWSVECGVSSTTWVVTGDQKVKNHLFHFVWNGLLNFFTTESNFFFLRFIRVKRKSVILNSIQFRVEFRSLKIYGCTAGHLQLNVAFDTVMNFFRFCSYHSSRLRHYHQRISWSAREHYHQSVIRCHDSLFQCKSKQESFLKGRHLQTNLDKRKKLLIS